MGHLLPFSQSVKFRAMRWFVVPCFLVGTALAAHTDGESLASSGLELCDLGHDVLFRLDEMNFKDPDGHYQPIFRRYNDEECQLSDFTEIEVLGEGGSATAILTEHKSGAQVVLKRFDKKKDLSSFNIAVEEIILHKLDHPNLAKGFCSFLHEDIVHIGMLYRSKMTLKKLAEGSIAFEDLQKYASQMVDVLLYLHDKGIIHNDVKPGNILILEGGDIQLIDYNLTSYEPRGILKGCGSPLYMSPEKLDFKEYTNAVDWYAFGIMLAELANGMHPFKGAKLLSELKKMAMVLPISVPYEPIINSLVEKLCMKDPTERWCHANGNREDISNHDYILGYRRRCLVA